MLGFGAFPCFANTVRNWLQFWIPSHTFEGQCWLPLPCCWLIWIGDNLRIVNILCRSIHLKHDGLIIAVADKSRGSSSYNSCFPKLVAKIQLCASAESYAPTPRLTHHVGMTKTTPSTGDSDRQIENLMQSYTKGRLVWVSVTLMKSVGTVV